MKVLVTGAKGFTGVHLSEALLTRGFEVESLESNLCDIAVLRKEIALCDPHYVIHLAGASYGGDKTSSLVYQSNFNGTRNLLNSISIGRKNSLKRIIVASSASVYGNSPPSPVNESVPPEPGSDYAWSKLGAEYACFYYGSELPIKIVRPFNYTGVGQAERFLVPKLVRAFADRSPIIRLGNLSISREFNDVRDACAVYTQLLEVKWEENFVNLCSGRSVSLEYLVQLLQKISGHLPKIERDESLIRNADPLNLVGDDSKLRALIGRRFRTHIDETIEWMYRNATAVVE